MRIAAKAGMITLQMANGFVNMFLLITILLLLAFGCYAIWDSNQIHSAASHMRYERYRPSAEDDGISFANLQAINPDVFAWLTVFGTNIDYPVVQGRDNMRYINTNAEGGHSLSGAIFLDYRNASYFADFSNILYGHHMESRTMFGEIGMFADEAYFNARRHGMLFYDGQEYGLDFFAFVHVDAHDFSVFRVNISGQEAQQAYLDLLMEIAIHTHDDVIVKPRDRIVLLSTCSPNSTNGRDILIGKITDDVRIDSFVRESDTNNAIPINIPMIDTLPSLWAQAVNGIEIATLILVCVFILLGGIFICKKVTNKRKVIRLFTICLALACVITVLFAPRVYAASAGQVTFEVEQILTGNNLFTPPKATFNYLLAPKATDAPMPYGSNSEGYMFTITGNNKAQISWFNFDTPGIFTYTLSCITNAVSGFTIDRRVYTIEVYVTGDLQVVIIVYNGDVKVSNMYFEHTYERHPEEPGSPGGTIDRPVVYPTIPEEPGSTPSGEIDIPSEPTVPYEPTTPQEPEIPEEPDAPGRPGTLGESPKTGDYSNPMLWITSIVMSGILLIFTIFIVWKSRRRRF